jgi:hypothetical protein
VRAGNGDGSVVATFQQRLIVAFARSAFDAR